MTPAKAKAKSYNTFIVQASLFTVNYNHKMFIVQATVGLDYNRN